MGTTADSGKACGGDSATTESRVLIKVVAKQREI